MALAHRQGILTSASLMIGGDAAEEAIRIARQTPTLAVGLHVVAVDGRPVLPSSQLQHLVDSTGQFPDTAAALGLKYAFSQTCRDELAREIAAQFEAFAGSGLPLSHVDGHQHMHVHPSVFPIVLPLARRYGARRFRLPRDNVSPRSGARGALNLIFSALSRACLPRVRDAGLAITEHCFGLIQSGRMTESYVLSLLPRIRQSAEIYFHPTTGPRLDELGPNPQDLQTLLNPRLKQAIKESGIALSGWTGMSEAEASAPALRRQGGR